MSPRRRERRADEVTWALREELAKVDDVIVARLAERMDLVARLWAHKRTVGAPLESLPQEARVLARVERRARDQGLRPAFVARLFRSIIAEGKRSSRARRPAGRVRRPRAARARVGARRTRAS